MRKDKYTAVSILLLLSLACRAEAGVNPPKPLTLWSVAVTACADGVLPGSVPDNRCTIGENGDIPLEVNVGLADIFGTKYDVSITDPITGTTTLTGSLPQGYTPYVSHPNTVIVTSPDGKSDFFVKAPEEATIVESEGNKITIELPYQKPSPPRNDPNL